VTDVEQTPEGIEAGAEEDLGGDIEVTADEG
jgi:hypothetical protein